MTQARIAIIGAGVVGATAALVLARAGHPVDLYSDRTAEQLRDEVPATGTAVLFGHSRDVDHTLVEELYPDAPLSTGMNTRLNTGEPGALEQVLAFDPDFTYTAAGIDVRLRAHDRIRLFEEAGGSFHVETVTPEELDAVAAAHDLTLVSTGKGGLSGLFPVDEARTVYRSPQRHLLAAAFTGLGHGDDVFTARGHGAGKHNVFNLHTDHGEIWIGPYWHKDVGATWSVLGFAKPDGDWVQRWGEVTDAQSALEVVVSIYRDYFPDDLADIEKLRVIEEDRHSWLRGAVTPTVRQGVGYTRSGRPVLALGDSAIAFDPIAGQGAQTGLIQVAALVKAIEARGSDSRPNGSPTSSTGTGRSAATPRRRSPVCSSAIRTTPSPPACSSPARSPTMRWVPRCSACSPSPRRSSTSTRRRTSSASSRTRRPLRRRTNGCSVPRNGHPADETPRQDQGRRRC